MKVLLIGGSSDLGRELGKTLSCEFYNFDLSNENPFVSNFIKGDLTNPSSLESLLGLNFDSVIHISGIHPIIASPENNDLMFKVNVQGVFNVLNWLNQKSKTKKYLLISSSSAKKLNTEYGKTKFLAENVLESFCEGNGFTGFSLRTRGFTPYYSKHYKRFIDYANWVLTGAVHIKDVVQSVNLCLNASVEGYEQFLVDGLDSFTQEEKSLWGKDMLIRKYPQFKDFIDSLDIPLIPPKYELPQNSVGYKPSIGVDYLFQEFIDQSNKKSSKP